MSREVRDVIASVAPRRLVGDRRMLMGCFDSALRPAYGWIGTISLSRQDGMASSRLGEWSPLWGGAASASTSLDGSTQNRQPTRGSARRLDPMPTLCEPRKSPKPGPARATDRALICLCKRGTVHTPADRPPPARVRSESGLMLPVGSERQAGVGSRSQGGNARVRRRLSRARRVTSIDRTRGSARELIPARVRAHDAPGSGRRLRPWTKSEVAPTRDQRRVFGLCPCLRPAPAGDLEFADLQRSDLDLTGPQLPR
jgi:hypothetical protein